MYKLREDLAIVQTVDFFTPIVDDPYDFGAIAAANALSDCFTLGAQPVTGLNLVSFPCRLGLDILKEILRGGADKMSEAGGIIVGGHSVDDEEPKYGIAVTGVLHPDEMVTNDSARPGDLLVLTKKIGTGIVTNVFKSGGGLGKVLSSVSRVSISEETYQEVVESMKTLNNIAGKMLVEAKVNASTDITGFGLLGHAYDMAQASGVQLEISYSSVPLFDDIEAHALSGTKGGGERNRKYLAPFIDLSEGTGDSEFAILADAQTSGPLLISIEEKDAEAFVEKLQKARVAAAAIVGKVTSENSGRVKVVS